MTITLKFCGAAGTVTGSCFLLSHPGGRVLVDCGMFQGPKTLRELNYGAFPFDPSSLDAVLLTHAHIDHSGLLPKLCRDGYRGEILATVETKDLLKWMLPDSGAIQEAEVQRLNRRNARRGRPPVDPIYTRDQAEAALRRIAVVKRDRWIDAAPGIRARYVDAGHILGAASIELEVASEEPEQPAARLLFSGDIGPQGKAFSQGPQGSSNFDYIVVEATYGDRERQRVSEAGRRAALKREVLAAHKAGGSLLIPAFAVERTQELLHDLVALMAEGALPRIPVFLDSPLALRATAVFEKYRHRLGLPRQGDSPFRAPNIHFVETVEQSKALGRLRAGAIIIAGSGMCEAGRIRYHLEDNLWRPEATVLFVGYQAPGTIGALLKQGVPAIRIHGQEVTVRARIRELDVYSGHADRRELLAWISARLPARRGIFITHGEESALAGLRDDVVALGFDRSRVIVPRLDQTFELYPATAARLMKPAAASRLEPKAEALVAGKDWHNDYAALVLDLQHKLRATDDEPSRRKLLRRLRRVLQ